jgi:tetratricopeptide (TPR) repeat protein
MSDEEDAYPDEDDLAAQSGAGANVATVTLAEIYFQQGLREQALQIYRQLLEREPENDSVRKRIEEIEATKPDGGEPGPGSDPRRPRPGLKVPKRKK